MLETSRIYLFKTFCVALSTLCICLFVGVNNAEGGLLSLLSKAGKAEKAGALASNAAGTVGKVAGAAGASRFVFSRSHKLSSTRHTLIAGGVGSIAAVTALFPELAVAAARQALLLVVNIEDELRMITHNGMVAVKELKPTDDLLQQLRQNGVTFPDDPQVVMEPRAISPDLIRALPPHVRPVIIDPWSGKLYRIQRLPGAPHPVIELSPGLYLSIKGGPFDLHAFHRLLQARLDPQTLDFFSYLHPQADRFALDSFQSALAPKGVNLKTADRHSLLQETTSKNKRVLVVVGHIENRKDLVIRDGRNAVSDRFSIQELAEASALSDNSLLLLGCESCSAGVSGYANNIHSSALVSHLNQATTSRTYGEFLSQLGSKSNPLILESNEVGRLQGVILHQLDEVRAKNTQGDPTLLITVHIISSPSRANVLASQGFVHHSTAALNTLRPIFQNMNWAMIAFTLFAWLFCLSMIWFFFTSIWYFLSGRWKSLAPEHSKYAATS